MLSKCCWLNNTWVNAWVTIRINEDTLSYALLGHFCHVWLFVTLWTMCCQAPLSMWGSPGKNIGISYHAFLQGIFPTQGSNCVSYISCIGGGCFTTSTTWEAKIHSLMLTPLCSTVRPQNSSLERRGSLRRLGTSGQVVLQYWRLWSVAAWAVGWLLTAKVRALVSWRSYWSEAK